MSYVLILLDTAAPAVTFGTPMVDGGTISVPITLSEPPTTLSAVVEGPGGTYPAQIADGVVVCQVAAQEPTGGVYLLTVTTRDDVGNVADAAIAIVMRQQAIFVSDVEPTVSFEQLAARLQAQASQADMTVHSTSEVVEGRTMISEANPSSNLTGGAE